MRNYNISAITLIVMSMLSPASHAADVTISVIGNLMSNSCTVSAESKNKVVNMGTWPVKQFSSTSSGTLPPVPFVITLEDCGETVSGATITFNGTPDPENNALLKLNDESLATHVAIALLDKNQKRIPLNEPSESYGITGGEGKIELQFYGQYVASGDGVTAGSANADATFSLTYQ